MSLAEADQLSETSRAQPLPIVSRLTPEKLESGLASEIAVMEERALLWGRQLVRLGGVFPLMARWEIKGRAGFLLAIFWLCAQTGGAGLATAY